MAQADAIASPDSAAAGLPSGPLMEALQAAELAAGDAEIYGIPRAEWLQLQARAPWQAPAAAPPLPMADGRCRWQSAPPSDSLPQR
jgi:hypothetical protein